MEHKMIKLYRFGFANYTKQFFLDNVNCKNLSLGNMQMLEAVRSRCCKTYMQGQEP